MSASTCVNLYIDLFVFPVFISYEPWYEDIFWCSIIIIIYLWLDESDSAKHADVVGRGLGDCTTLIGVDSHCGHTWFSTKLVYSRFLLSTYNLIMSIFLAELTLLNSCCAFLSLLMGSFPHFPHFSLLSWFWGLPLWEPCLLLLLLGWALPLPGPLPLPWR